VGLKVYNSLTRNKDDFEPLAEGRVGMYVCGPTVYGHAHLGHAKSYVSFDILARYLRYLGYSLTYIQNITDVGHLTDDADEGDDKIVEAAKKEKKHPMALAQYYTQSFFEDMDKLNCVRPDISPLASGHITEQIDLVKTLIEKGYAYEVNGSVYFEVAKFDGYGKLSGRNIEEMQAGARVDVSPDKKNPADFALWKKAQPNHIMQWPSPWGMGYPGWHLECSAMSMKYLGATIDIHGGGLENKFPHHECEIAQSEAANGVQFVKYWLHNNMVTVDGQKMGKSLNNFITLKQVFSGAHERLTRAYDPLAIRQLILNSHYRSPLDFSDAALFAAQSGYNKITAAAIAVRGRETSAPKGKADDSVLEELARLKSKFEDAMNDDLNTAVALSVMFDLVRLLNTLFDRKDVTGGTLNAVDQSFRELGGDVLGIVKQSYGTSQITVAEHNRLLKVINNFLEERKKARNQKDFKTADKIRDIMVQSDVIICDDEDGSSRWEVR
jgi:cysteinyl-tRNA synthetase